jgi:prophage DNA circulation protein
VVSLANASSAYQPSSSNDAINVRNTVTGLLDNEIDIAGDSFEDATFTALRTLRQAVVTDLNTRGAALPSLKSFAFQAQLPAAVLALRIYRDPSRADQLVSEAAPAHPSFMPGTFQALSS